MHRDPGRHAGALHGSEISLVLSDAGCMMFSAMSCETDHARRSLHRVILNEDGMAAGIAMHAAVAHWFLNEAIPD